MSEKDLSEKYFGSDDLFNSLYPEHIREVAQRHWTPMEVARKASDFLSTNKGARILDIGSGAGKFCLIAAHSHRDIYFTGVEQRAYLVELCNDLKEQLHLTNVAFINQNIRETDLSEFDHFYFYNSFYENIPGTQKIDYEVEYSERLYDYYNQVLYKKLNETPVGTRLVTYHSLEKEIPPGFMVVNADYYNLLKFWQKV